MTELYIAAGVVVGLLMAYLLVALVKPEMFP
jgi:K+-transporting ATPase KdpF subunit